MGKKDLSNKSEFSIFVRPSFADFLKTFLMGKWTSAKGSEKMGVFFPQKQFACMRLLHFPKFGTSEKNGKRQENRERGNFILLFSSRAKLRSGEIYCRFYNKRPVCINRRFFVRQKTSMLTCKRREKLVRWRDGKITTKGVQGLLVWKKIHQGNIFSRHSMGFPNTRCAKIWDFLKKISKEIFSRDKVWVFQKRNVSKFSENHMTLLIAQFTGEDAFEIF